MMLLSSFTFFRGQQSNTYREIKWENGSETAKKIMKSDFYYDPLDSWSPFGSDIGNDTYYLYADWNTVHPRGNIKNFIKDQLIDLGYPAFDLSLDGSDTNRLHRIVDTMTNKYVDLNMINQMIISLAFSQLFLSGKIEPEVQKFAEAAISREKANLDFWGDQTEQRRNRMDQLLHDLKRVK